MAKTNPFDFIQQVRSEAAKVTWPTRKETMITTAMVFVMVVAGERLLPGRRSGDRLGGALGLSSGFGG